MWSRSRLKISKKSQDGGRKSALVASANASANASIGNVKRKMRNMRQDAGVKEGYLRVSEGFTW